MSDNVTMKVTAVSHRSGLIKFHPWSYTGF